jgi:hypothetical protein
VKAESGSRLSLLDRFLDRLHPVPFMSDAGIEFLQAGPCAGKSRANRPDRHPQSDRGVLVAEPGPSAEHKDLLLATGKSCEEGEGADHPLFVVDPLVAVVREARLGAWLRNAPERRRVTTLGATAVANDVGRDPEQPREFLPLGSCLSTLRQASRKTIETRSSATAQLPTRRKQ